MFQRFFFQILLCLGNLLLEKCCLIILEQNIISAAGNIYECDPVKIRKIINVVLSMGLICTSLFAHDLSFFEEEQSSFEEQASRVDGHEISFHEIPIVEFIRFVSKISKENFIFNKTDLDFKIAFSSGKPLSTKQVVEALIQLLNIHHFHVTKKDSYYVIRKKGEKEQAEVFLSPDPVLASSGETLVLKPELKHSFHIYKLQYHEGSEIVESLKKIAVDMGPDSNFSAPVLKSIQSLQWVKTTNSLLFSGDPETVAELSKIVQSLDIPLKQVFIEILVIETDVKKSLDFGLQWAASGQYQGKVGLGMGNFAPQNFGTANAFASAMQGVNASSPPTGLSQVPIVPGFDLGVIGDIIMHKGKSFLSLGSLVSALQIDGDSTIVLNQKIITQDNKHSKIFVGDNIPFTGSVVQTIGQGQQTTANIEYRDVGVSLNITPMLGEENVITLNLDEEITEAVDDLAVSNANVSGIRTTKTNMLTHVHVPDKHFLVLSGMIRNAKARHKAGIPCLGGLPVIGAAFSKNREKDEKRNIIIFVRPQIIHSFEEYKKITEKEEETYQKQANKKNFEEALQVLPPVE